MSPFYVNSFVCPCVCVCVKLDAVLWCHCICRFVWPAPQLRQKVFPVRDPSCCLLTTLAASFPTLSLWQSLIHLNFYNFVISKMFPKWNHTGSNILELAFVSFSITPLRASKVVACIDTSSLLIAEQYSVVWMYHSFFNNLHSKGHLGCFQFWLL